MNDHSTAARAAIQRLSGLPQAAIEVRLEPGPEERFDVSAAGGRLIIAASTPVAAVTGYAQFARTTGAGSVSRSGVRPLAAIPDDAHHSATASVARRVAYNMTVGGYTTPFFSWSDWERELDLLAASGVNAAHLTLGQEAVWLDSFAQFGYTETELLAWIVPPSHQAWQWLNNIQGYGGGTSRELVESRAELARRVLARMDELGITPILPGFSGTVPPGLADRIPGAEIVPQGRWFADVAGPMRPDWLDTATPEYGRVAAAFYASQHRLFGVGGTWAVDLLHEGGKLGSGSLSDAATGVEAAMRAADPDYTWVVQGWGGNPRQELLDALDGEHLLILDLVGEHWKKMDGYRGVPWVWGILPNYGGRNGLYGDLSAVAAAPAELFSGTDAGNLVGITDMAEGVANNPVLWDLLHDIAWTREPIDLEAWMTAWVTARYGRADRNALAAWETIRRHAYGPWRIPETAPIPVETAVAMMGLPVDAANVAGEKPESPFDGMGAGEGEFEDFQIYAATDSIVNAVPSLDANQASSVGPRVLGYPADALRPALAELIAASDDLEWTPSFHYDLVDVARQVLVDTARLVLPRVKAAFEAADATVFEAHAAEFLELVDLLDDVLAGHPEFRLDTWTTAAAATTDDPAEQARVVGWTIRLLTVWGEREDGFLIEYATRDWAGLVGDYYRSRWERWFGELARVLRGEPTSAIDWYEHAEQWIESGAWAAAPSVTDPLVTARRALEFAERHA
jgi:alpha-N-acetylglucosaminidase